MDRYLKIWKAKSSGLSETSTPNERTNHVEVEVEVGLSNSCDTVPNQVDTTLVEEVDFTSLPADPADRKPIMIFHPNIRDAVRRHYIIKGPCQPRLKNYPKTVDKDKSRQFNSSWFDMYPNWLEYSMKKDAVFCLPCYLFHTNKLGHGGGDAFLTKGFNTWKKTERLSIHIGGHSSMHNQCCNMCIALMNQDQSIDTAVNKQEQKYKTDYQIRLNASIDVARFLLTSGSPFRGHDEREASNRKGNFLSLLNWYALRSEKVGDVVLRNVPANLHMTAPKIQKDIVRACASETLKEIIKDIDDDYFAILVDESRDVSHKEQMALVLRYVDRRGFVIETLIGIVHVEQTTAIALKEAVYSLLSQHSLSPKRIRGQCYDGASNMQGHMNGLRTLIMSDSRSAHSIHCFAHQQQLTLVAVAKIHEDVAWLFDVVTILLNILGVSFKNRDDIRREEAKRIEEDLRLNKLESGRGLNQELGLKKPGATRWGSHFHSLMNMISMFPSLVKVIGHIAVEGLHSDDRQKARGVLDSVLSFRFVFMLHLVKDVLAITNDLNTALQRKEQNIVNAMVLLVTAKRRLQALRDDGWEGLISKVTSFCCQQDIDIVDMDSMHICRGSRFFRRVDDVSNEHYYRVSVLYAVVDMQIGELNCRFSEVNTELLLGMACLNPDDSFSSFDKNKLLQMARLYPDDFGSENKIEELSCKLDNFIENMHDDSRFFHLKGIGELARKLVETKQHLTFYRVFLLLKLALILPVATSTVERAFSAMKYIKTDLRNKMGDEVLSDYLITYVERDTFETISNETIMHHFQAMKTRRKQL